MFRHLNPHSNRTTTSRLLLAVALLWSATYACVFQPPTPTPTPIPRKSTVESSLDLVLARARIACDTFIREEADDGFGNAYAFKSKISSAYTSALDIFSKLSRNSQYLTRARSMLNLITDLKRHSDTYLTAFNAGAASWLSWRRDTVQICANW